MEVEVLRGGDLLDPAVVHHHDAVGERHRLDLVVGDIDRRRRHRGVQLLDLGAHLHPQLGVEVGERLVEQEHLRIAHDRPPHRHALALAAGELARLAASSGAISSIAGRSLPSPPDLVARRLPQLEAEGDVVGDGQMRIERIVLEHHGDVPLARRQVVDPRPPIAISPAVDVSSPAIMRSVVDLPQPDGPTRTTNSPSAMSRSMPWTVCTPS